MSRIRRIALTEYLTAVRSKAFILGVILMPVMMGAGLIANAIAEKSKDVRDRQVAVYDETGRVFAELAAAAEERNEKVFERNEDGTKAGQTDSKYFLDEYVPESGAERSVELVLSDRVRDGDLFAFVVVGEDVFQSRKSVDDAVSYYSSSPTYDDLPDWIEDRIQELVEVDRFAKADLDAEVVSEATRPIRFRDRGLVEESADGEEIGGEEGNDIQDFLIPIASMFMLFMLVMTSAPQALNVVLEEKMQKISEVLISAVTPFELMMGKVMGTVLVSLTLSALYLGAILISTHYFEIEQMIPLRFYAWFLFFQLLALIIYTSMFAAIGAACSEMRDAQSLMTPAMFIVILPILFFAVVLKSPDSPMAIAVSLFPPATPMLMMMRVAIPPGPPVWQLVLAVVLTLGFTCLCIWAAGKVFRIGILATGQAPSLRKLLSWIVSK